MSGMDEESPSLGRFLAANIQQPEANIQREELRNQLAQAIGQLPDKHRKVIMLYYHRELTMKQIADVLELTESRVSQIHATAVFKLSVWLKQWDEKE
jgi:RNA polymerase sigma factor for flagellar operon FliA